LLLNNPVVDAVSLFPRQQFRGPLAPWRLLQWARTFGAAHPADLVLDFQCLLRSAIIGTFCKHSHFYGLSDAREGARFFYDAAVPVTASQHAVERYLALVGALGVNVEEPLSWPLPTAHAPAGFDLERPFIALHPFSRGKGKSLSIPDLETLCAGLAPARVVLVGRADTAPSSMPHVENWLNRTSLLELTAILKFARWTISVDSGPMHIAAALSSRVLSLHTWSDPQKVGPYRGDAWVWQHGFLFQRGGPSNPLPALSLTDVAAWTLKQIS
jgi:ADP-heptose:LPS heptosyltransferase